jgi:hypothetical protein
VNVISVYPRSRGLSMLLAENLRGKTPNLRLRTHIYCFDVEVRMLCSVIAVVPLEVDARYWD